MRKLCTIIHGRQARERSQQVDWRSVSKPHTRIARKPHHQPPLPQLSPWSPPARSDQSSHFYEPHLPTLDRPLESTPAVPLPARSSSFSTFSHPPPSAGAFGDTAAAASAASVGTPSPKGRISPGFVHERTTSDVFPPPDPLHAAGFETPLCGAWGAARERGKRAGGGSLYWYTTRPGAAPAEQGAGNFLEPPVASGGRGRV